MLPVILALLAADPTPEQTELLKTFRAEFVAIVPDGGKFPNSVTLGPRNDDGTPKPGARKVTFDYAFHIAKYEVPQDLWEAVMGSNPSRWKGKRNSVEMLSYAEAVEFCKKATELMRAGKLIAADEVIRLPSEAEWEYCCRAGTETAYSFGDDPKKLDDYGWHTGNAAGNDPPVGAKKPNPWGLYDVHGYLWEWCADTWHDDLSTTPQDGSPRTADAKARVVRGGSWKDKAERCNSSFRQGLPADAKDDAVGLRCVLAKEKK